MNKTELSDVIYENCSKINGKTSEAKFEKSVGIKAINAAQNFLSKIII